MLQEFVRERRLTQQRTVARDVMIFLWDQGFLDYNPDSKTSVSSAVWCT